MVYSFAPTLVCTVDSIGVKVDSILVELLQHLGGSSHQEGNGSVDGP